MPRSRATDDAPSCMKHENSAASDCPLSTSQQTANLVRWAAHVGLVYLAAPVAYVGEVDAILLNKLGYSDKVANLPTAAFFCMTAPFLVLFTWYFCQVRMLKTILVASYGVVAASGLLVAAALLHPCSNWVVAALIAHAMLMGWCLGIIGLYEWEILARGVSERRRGLALGLAYGVGPVLAVLGSLATQLLLDGRIGPFSVGKLDYPWDFFTLFLGSVLVMGLPAISAAYYVVPMPAVEIVREPLVSGVFGGFRDFIENRLLLLASVAMLLTVLGATTILPSVVLYMKSVLGEAPQKYAGYQFAMRFAFKAAAGVVLGWMLAKTHPRAGLSTTTGLCLGGLIWALITPGKWYLLSFGILGTASSIMSIFKTTSSPVRRRPRFAGIWPIPTCWCCRSASRRSCSDGSRTSSACSAALRRRRSCWQVRSHWCSSGCRVGPASLRRARVTPKHPRGRLPVSNRRPITRRSNRLLQEYTLQTLKDSRMERCRRQYDRFSGDMEHERFRRRGCQPSVGPASIQTSTG